MEHSLKAIADWEALTNKPYFDNTGSKKQGEDIWLYLNCMLLDDSIELSEENVGVEEMEQIQAYLEKSQTATTLKTNPDEKKKKRIVTAEQIYASMIKAGVAKEYEMWNIDRLTTLLGVLADMFEEKKPMTQAEIYEQNAKLNAERRKKLNSKG